MLVNVHYKLVMMGLPEGVAGSNFLAGQLANLATI